MRFDSVVDFVACLIMWQRHRHWLNGDKGSDERRGELGIGKGNGKGLVREMVDGALSSF